MSSFHEGFDTENRTRSFPAILKGSEEIGKALEKPTEFGKKLEKTAKTEKT